MVLLPQLKDVSDVSADTSRAEIVLSPQLKDVSNVNADTSRVEIVLL